MKNPVQSIRLLLCLLIGLTATQARSGDVPPFGQQYLDWVKTKSTYYSQQICEHDFRVSLLNAYNKEYREGTLLLQELDTLLAVLEDSIRTQQTRLKTIEDETERYYLRNYYAHQNQELVFGIEHSFALLKGHLLSVDSVGTRRVFDEHGLYNVGTASMMESFTEVGDKLSHYLPEKYPFRIGVQYTVNYDGETEGAGVSGGEYATYGAMAGAIIGSYVPVIGTILGGFIGGAVGSVVDFFVGKRKDAKRQKEFNRQKELLYAGVDLLPSKLLTNDAQFAIYQSFDQAYRDSFQSLRAIIDTQSLQLRQAFDQLSVINLINKRVAKNYLGQKKLAALKEKYEYEEQTETILAYSDATLLLQRLSDDIRFVKKNNQRLNQLSKIYEIESFRELIFNNMAFLEYTLDANAYPLITDELKAYINTYKTELKKVNNLLQAKGAIGSNPVLGNPYWNLGVAGYSLFGRALRKPSIISIPFQPAFKEIEVDPEMPTIGFNVVSQTYYLEKYGNGSSVTFYVDETVFNGGADTRRDILGSSYDGGMKNFSAQATHQINSASRQLDNRIERVQTTYQKLAPISQQWRQQSQDFFTEPMVPDVRQNEIAGQANELMNEQGTALASYESVLQEMVKPNGAANLTYISKQKRLNLLSDFVKDQPELLASSVQSPLLEGYGEIQSKEQVVVDKLGKSLQTAEQAVAGEGHPVIKNEKALREVIQQSEQLVTYIENLKEQGYSKMVIDHYLDELNDIRLYLDGYQTDPTVVAMKGDDKERREVFEQGVEKLDACIARQGLANCELRHEVFFGQLSGNRSQEKLVFMGQGANPNSLRQLSTEMSKGHTIVLIDPSDNDQERYAVVEDGYYENADDVRVTYIDLKNPTQSKYNVPLKEVYKNPEKLIIYEKEQASFYGNTNVQSFEGQADAGQCYDVEIGYYDCQKIDAKINYQQGGEERSRKESIQLEDDYIKDIQLKYGANAPLVYEHLRDNLNDYFPTGILPEEQQTESYQKLVKSIQDFDRSYPLVDTRNIYKSQALHALLNITNEAIRLSESPSEIEALIKEATEYTNLILDLGTSLTPGINDGRDLYELLTGVDLISQEEIGVLGRVLAGGGLVMGSGALFRKILQSTASGATIKIVKAAKKLRGFPGMRYITEGKFKGSMISENGIIYSKQRKYDIYEKGIKVGEKKEHSFFHIASNHHVWGEGKISEKAFRKRKNSRYSVSEKEIVLVNDRAMDIIKKNKPGTVMPPSKPNPNSRGYIVDMGGEVIGERKNGEEMTCLFIAFDKTTDYNAIRTSYPVRCPN